MRVRAHIAAALSGLVSASGGCDPDAAVENDPGEPVECASGFVVENGSCVPEACGTGRWGDLVVDEHTVFVDIAAPDGGDGTEAGALRSIQAGLDLAGSAGGGLVAVAAGSYPETLVFTTDHAGVELAGRCRELVILDASVGDSSSPGIDISTWYGEAGVSGIWVSGSNYVGVRVETGVVRLTDLLVEGSAYVGMVAIHSGAPPTTVEVEHSELSDNRTIGLYVSGGGGDVTVSNTTIRDTRPREGDNEGVGILAKGGASVRVHDGLVTGNAAMGIVAYDDGTEITLEDTSIRDTLPDGDGVFGYGIFVFDAADLLAEGCELAGNRTAGVVAAEAGSEVKLEDCVVQDTQWDALGERGFGLWAYSGARIEASGCELVRNRAAGVFFGGMDTELVLESTVVRDTLPEADLHHGKGVYAAEGGKLLLEGCEVVGNTTMGVEVAYAGTQANLVDTVVRDTLPSATGENGVGVGAHDGATLAARGCEIAGSTTVGVAAFDAGTDVSLEDTVVQDTLPDINNEYGYGIQVFHGATLSARGCALRDNVTCGLLAYHRDTTVTIVDTRIVGTKSGLDLQGATAVAVCAIGGASVSAQRLEAHGNEGPGLLSWYEGSQVECRDCALRDNWFAGAASVDGGDLLILDSAITGTGEGVDIGGGVGVFAAQQWGEVPPSVRVAGSTISDNLVAGVWLEDAGSFLLLDNHFVGSLGVAHGGSARCGDGVYASGISAWEGDSGLLLDGNVIEGNAGAGLLLDNAAALLSGNSWVDNGLDLVVQGEACLAPESGYAEVPSSEICPAWDRPVCGLHFTLTLNVQEVEASLLSIPAPSPSVPRAHRDHLGRAGEIVKQGLTSP